MTVYLTDALRAASRTLVVVLAVAHVANWAYDHHGTENIRTQVRGDKSRPLPTLSVLALLRTDGGRLVGVTGRKAFAWDSKPPAGLSISPVPQWGAGDAKDGNCALLNPAQLWADAEAEHSPTALRRIKAYLGWLGETPHLSPHRIAVPMGWLINASANSCQRCRSTTMPLNGVDVSVCHLRPAAAEKLKRCPHNTDARRRFMPKIARTFAEAADAPGSACVRSMWMLLEYQCEGGSDDTSGLHWVPTLTKTRPIVPPALRSAVMYDAGVLLPLQINRFWDPVVNIMTKRELAFSKKRPAAVWRGGVNSGQGDPRSGPVGGIASMQRFGQGAVLVKWAKHLRGEPGGFFLPGWPAAFCGNRSTPRCQQAVAALQGQPSRIELVHRWHNTSKDIADIQHMADARAVATINRDFDGILFPPAGDPLNVEGMLKFRYLVSTEGVDKASNLQWVLWADAVPLMPPPSIESWFLESWLVPWVHYVPLRPDFADLADQVLWCNGNLAQAGAIAAAGRAFLIEHFGAAAHRGRPPLADPNVSIGHKGWQNAENRIAQTVLRLYLAHLAVAGGLQQNPESK